jgi:GrpB-like predicted nucleotidyltransferase (UPF0157 family)
LVVVDYDPAWPQTYGRWRQRVAVRRWSDDGWAYTEAKTGVILDILEQAEDWAVATSWAPRETRHRAR